MSGAEIIGIISSTISIIDAIVQVCDALRDASGLSATFRNALRQLPLLKTTLTAAQEGMETRANESSYNNLRETLESCQEKVNSLEEIFQAVMVESGASRRARYVSAIRSFGKEHRVEELMNNIIRDMQLLTASHAIETVKTSQIHGLIMEMRDTSRSRLDTSHYCSISNYGTGLQSIHYGTGDQNINIGSGSQFNGSLTGSITFYSS